MKKNTIITGILLLILLILWWYIAFLQNKVNATEDIRVAQARIKELKWLITDAQESYQIAQDSIVECQESWTSVMNKAHDDAQMYRDEIEELEGFLLQR